jgi:hypothetical protein
MRLLRACWFCDVSLDLDEAPTLCPICGVLDPCGTDPIALKKDPRYQAKLAAARAAVSGIFVPLPIDDLLRMDYLLWGESFEQRVRLPDGTIERRRIDPRRITIKPE